MPTDPILPQPYFDGKVTTIHGKNRFVSLPLTLFDMGFYEPSVMGGRHEDPLS